MSNAPGPEAKIERATCNYARKHDVLAIKLSDPHFNGLPDRMFISRQGVIAFVEFKRQGGKPTALQERVMRDLVNRHCDTFIIDSADSGKQLIDAIQDVRKWQFWLYSYTTVPTTDSPVPRVLPQVPGASPGSLPGTPGVDALARHGARQNGGDTDVDC